MSISRRTFIRGAAGAAAVPVPAAAEALSPRNRLDLAIADLQAAAEEAFPGVCDWMIRVNPAKPMPVLIYAYTPVGKEMSEPMYPAKPGATI
jgi:hypothetical protein